MSGFGRGLGGLTRLATSYKLPITLYEFDESQLLQDARVSSGRAHRTRAGAVGRNQNDTPARRSGGLLRNAEKKIMIEPFIISFKAANKTRNKQTTNKTQQGHMVTAA